MPAPWTVRAIRDAVASGQCLPSEVCQLAIDRIRERDGHVGAFLAVAEGAALGRAAELDGDRDAARRLPLAGVPVAVKDNICTAGLETTAGSHVLAGFVPPRNATAVSRLVEAGAIVIGKTNLDEFAMGSSTEYSAFHPSRNPWDLRRSPGGSSGGSAAAVAARIVPAAFGSDTGGSVRQPAAFCGLVGLRPTYGRVSRSGLVAFASSLDQIGPLTLTVEDAAILLAVTAGQDPLDATTTSDTPPGYWQALTGDVRGLRVGVPWHLLESGVEDEVARAFQDAVGVLRQRGASIVEVGLPHAPLAVPVYYILATAEASSNLARYDGVRYGLRAPEATGLADLHARTRQRGFGPEVKRRILLGTYVLSAGYYEAHYRKAQQVRTLIVRDHESAFERADVLALPTSPTPAFRLGERLDDPLQMWLADVFTVAASLAGLPALSVPMGFTPSGLPMGLQVVGRRLDEATVLRVGDAYERETGWWKREPGFGGPHAAPGRRRDEGGAPDGGWPVVGPTSGPPGHGRS